MWCLVNCNQFHFTIGNWVIIDQPSQASVIKGGVDAEWDLKTPVKSGAQKENQKRAMVTIKQK